MLRNKTSKPSMAHKHSTNPSQRKMVVKKKVKTILPVTTMTTPKAMFTTTPSKMTQSLAPFTSATHLQRQLFVTSVGALQHKAAPQQQQQPIQALFNMSSLPSLFTKPRHHHKLKSKHSLHDIATHQHLHKNQRALFSSSRKDDDDNNADAESDASEEKEEKESPSLDEIMASLVPMSAEELASNPLCVKSTLPFNHPPLDQIKFEHFKPAILEGMRQQKEEIKKITDNTDEPTFENTILAYELTGDLYSHATNIVGNLSGSDSTDELIELEEEMMPLYSNHSDDIHFNVILFQRIQKVFEDMQAHPEKFAHLTPENRRLIELTHKEFVLSGAKLSEESRGLMREYNVKLSTLEQKFGTNLIKITQTAGLEVTDVNDLEGLSESQIAHAKAVAKQRKLPEGTYVLELVNTTRNPLLTSLKNRDVRKKLFEASVNRGLDDTFAQQDVVYEIVTTRAKVAGLFGFKTFAEYQLQSQMADVKTAFHTLVSTIEPVKKNITRETAALLKLFKQHHPDAELESHDWEYYAERVRESDFNVDSSVLSEYFEFNNVIENCVFFTMNKLWGITLKQRHDLPTQHKNIRIYDVLDHDGTVLGLFHGDWFARSPDDATSKSGGAWMSEWVGQNKDRNEKAVGINNMNIVFNPNGPTFLTLDEVSTANHEFGHFFHGLSSQAQHASLAGTNTPTDFVEFPSTVLEDFSIHPEVLANYAKHYKTGEPIPQDLLKRVIDASKFNLGFETLEYVTAALLDLEWHNLSLEELETFFGKYDNKKDAIQAFEVQTLQRHNAYIPIVPPRYKAHYFSHSMTSYSARYYSYMFSEVYAADAYRYMTELAPQAGLNRTVGDMIRKEIYNVGNTRDPVESYTKFRGAPPTTEALLLRRGLTVEKQ